MLGGGFDATQAFVGDLANFHIWDRKLSVGEIYNLATCSSKAQVGNVFAWMETSLDIYGGASKWTFEACRQLNWTANRRGSVQQPRPPGKHKDQEATSQRTASGFVRDTSSIIYGHSIDFLFLPHDYVCVVGAGHRRWTLPVVLECTRGLLLVGFVCEGSWRRQEEQRTSSRGRHGRPASKAH